MNHLTGGKKAAKHSNALERAVTRFNPTNSKERQTDEEKLSSNYESLFGDVVTPCYVLGYN